MASTADYQSLVEQAQLAIRNGRLDQAEDKCVQLLNLEPKSPAALAMAAEVASRSGNTSVAIVRLRALLDLGPGTWEAHNALCQMLLSVGEIREAIEVGRRGCAAHPKSPQLLCGLGQCLIIDWQYGEALDCYDRALALAPSFSPAHHSRGIVLRMLCRDDEAEKAFRRASELEPNAPPPLIHLTKLLLDHGRSAEAEKSIAAATEATNRNPAWRPHFAAGLMEIGLNAQAEGPLRDALAANPGSGEILSTLGHLLQRLGRFPEASSCFEQLIERHPDEVRGYFDLFQCRRVLETDRKTMSTVNDMLAKASLTPAEKRLLNYALGKAHDDLAEYEAAFGYYKAANELSAMAVAGYRIPRERLRADFDRIAAVFTPEFFTANSDIGSASDAPILILGMIRSGTSLVRADPLDNTRRSPQAETPLSDPACGITGAAGDNDSRGGAGDSRCVPPATSQYRSRQAVRDRQNAR